MMHTEEVKALPKIILKPTWAGVRVKERVRVRVRCLN
jgi:hypothetical protein